MTTTATTTWAEDNQRYLSPRSTRLGGPIAPDRTRRPRHRTKLDALAARMTRPPALRALTTRSASRHSSATCCAVRGG